ncbi:hypothetical protein BASA50_006322 [Batrachochytrium salamandrivorans]|uniref:Polysaccharide lyase 14 domain-containing protein n=1 Tax=Batrachochytrium salamandrivorans TaxID=1357716 RepID=A0ABQ8FAW9_9FUNG|nr:hypothetical protein BASA62_000320 [Batrachochytrium salamandrivorans]KAH6574466.1 hypothetical protein BASA60_005492 [Batrachochytrium salamandrivorans]KAH6594848.1 hypothetical protein BASA50_006322 [Batrachochytrium salamandrivorans]KAH9267099.1 hypothetical protein BASA84_000824 [Batrachochytrium salamandrivorans]
MRLTLVTSALLTLSGLAPMVFSTPVRPGCNADSGCGRKSVGCAELCSAGDDCSINEDCRSNVCTRNSCVGNRAPQPAPPGCGLKPTTTQAGLGQYSISTKSTSTAGSASTSTKPSSGPPTPTPPPPSPPTAPDDKFWELSGLSNSSIGDFNIISDRYGKNNRKVVPDPVVPGTNVLQILYPKGSYKPSGPIVGGTGFYAKPLDIESATKVTLQYDIYFPTGFNFVKGGKLPGLYGGHESCSGGRDSETCFSSRFMFRGNGAAETYLYLDFPSQVPEFCQVPPRTICNPDFGTSLGRGAWTWRTGRWVTASETITLNTLGETDGAIEVKIDGVTMLSFDQIAWRTANFGFLGIHFDTFFGGNTADWATPIDQHILFKDFQLIILE